MPDTRQKLIDRTSLKGKRSPSPDARAALDDFRKRSRKAVAFDHPSLMVNPVFVETDEAGLPSDVEKFAQDINLASKSLHIDKVNYAVVSTAYRRILQIRFWNDNNKIEKIITFKNGDVPSDLLGRTDKSILDSEFDNSAPRQSEQWQDKDGPVVAGPPADRRRRTTPLANPEKPRWAEENRSKQQVKLRLAPALAEAAEARAKSKGVTRNEWIEGLIIKALSIEP